MSTGYAVCSLGTKVVIVSGSSGCYRTCDLSAGFISVSKNFSGTQKW
jgi:hypothetical protein